MKCIGYSSTAASRDGSLRRTTKAVQVAEGDVIGGWQVTGGPTRGLNGLQWSCRCTAGHVQNIAHSLLEYGIAPTCQECVQFAIAVSMDARRHAKSTLRAASLEIQNDALKRRAAQRAQDAKLAGGLQSPEPKAA
jgi:hypothetical protein